MKRYRNYAQAQAEHDRKQKRKREQHGGFKCCNCRQQVVIHAFMGTGNRNHCNMCLWSRHVDEKKGDRKAACQAGMKPVGLTFRIEGHGRRGELMLVHVCSGCAKISINRIAADDLDHEILTVFEQSFSMAEQLQRRIVGGGVLLALKADGRDVRAQLFGL